MNKSGVIILSNNWVFNDLPNTMVLTTKDVLIMKKPILFVSHDEDDSMWQFHCGEDVDMDNATLVSLKEIVDYDTSVTILNDLPLGWIAWRETESSPWTRQKN
ncbi:hypothetical protein [Paenibacillus ehimensis]|uniref:hypothetical protein n=1 Tax=Paenibacillus ehimensis TaxID=79264 RepID=UPI0006840EDB|nr:hypothetical protein [Paenibacillus ehimensis]